MSVGASTTVTPADAAGRLRPTLPLSLYGIPLGLAGLGGAWSAAVAQLNAVGWPAEVLYAVSTAVWATFSVIYLRQAVTRRGTFGNDLRHPAQGPFAAFAPLVGILLSAHYAQYLALPMRWLCVVFVVVMAVIAAQLLAHWFTGGVTMDTIHPGYFLPVVAGAFVASIGLSSVGAHAAAIGAFGIGMFFWLVIGTVVVVRLMTATALPAPLVPSLSAFVAAPATANIAWLVAHPGPLDQVQLALTGVLAIMLLIQLTLAREYGRLSFGMSFWVFTFPVASTTNYLVRWAAAARFSGWELVGWLVLGIATAFTGTVAARTLTDLVRTRRLRRSASAH